MAKPEWALKPGFSNPNYAPPKTFKGKRMVPKAAFILPAEARNKFKEHFKLLKNSKGEYQLLISPLMKVALDNVSRGRNKEKFDKNIPIYDKDEGGKNKVVGWDKQENLSMAITLVIPSDTRSFLKKATPRIDPNTDMYPVGVITDATSTGDVGEIMEVSPDGEIVFKGPNWDKQKEDEAAYSFRGEGNYKITPKGIDSLRSIKRGQNPDELTNNSISTLLSIYKVTKDGNSVDKNKIAEDMGKSVPTIAYDFDRLNDKGLIELEDKEADKFSNTEFSITDEGRSFLKGILNKTIEPTIPDGCIYSLMAIFKLGKSGKPATPKNIEDFTEIRQIHLKKYMGLLLNKKYISSKLDEDLFLEMYVPELNESSDPSDEDVDRVFGGSAKENFGKKREKKEKGSDDYLYTSKGKKDAPYQSPFKTKEKSTKSSNDDIKPNTDFDGEGGEGNDPSSDEIRKAFRPSAKDSYENDDYQKEERNIVSFLRGVVDEINKAPSLMDAKRTYYNYVSNMPGDFIIMNSNSLDKISQNIEKVRNLPALQSYLYYSILNFEKLGVGKKRR